MNTEKILDIVKNMDWQSPSIFIISPANWLAMGFSAILGLGCLGIFIYYISAKLKKPDYKDSK